jgi:hypothetical protein
MLCHGRLQVEMMISDKCLRQIQFSDQLDYINSKFLFDHTAFKDSTQRIDDIDGSLISVSITRKAISDKP